MSTSEHISPSEIGKVKPWPFSFAAMPVMGMSRDSGVKWFIIGATLIFDFLLIQAGDLQFPVADCFKPLMIVGMLSGVAVFYQLRRTPQFVMCLMALIQLTIFTSSYSVLMYSGATWSFPLVDDWLVDADRLCGVHLPSVVAWTAQHPTISRVLEVAYSSMLIQTPIVIILLGFGGERRSLESFMLQFMLSTWIAAMIFFVMPAEGPFSAYGYEPDAMQRRYLEHFHSLRSGERTLVTWRNAEGLITFPSYHTTWAVLLTFALRRRITWFVPSLLLNIAVVVSTLTTDWHYFADVLGGLLVAAVVIPATTRLERWLYPSENLTTAACPTPGTQRLLASIMDSP